MPAQRGSTSAARKDCNEGKNRRKRLARCFAVARTQHARSLVRVSRGPRRAVTPHPAILSIRHLAAKSLANTYSLYIYLYYLYFRGTGWMRSCFFICRASFTRTDSIDGRHVVNNQSISLFSNINRLKIARDQIWQITRQIAFI